MGRAANVVSVAVLAVASVARAQDPAPTEPPADDVLTVTVTRSATASDDAPLAVTTVDVAPLEPRGPGPSLADLTTAIPGVLVRNRTNLAQGPRISIRGSGARSAFGIRGVAVVLDGIPLSLADGLAQVDLVDPALIGRIEVLRGPAGALYGNAAGGVLALTSAGGDQRPGEDVLLTASSDGSRKLVARAAGTVRSGEYVVAASALDQEGARSHADAERYVVHTSNRWSVGDRTDVRFVASYVDVPIARDPGGLTAEEMAADPTQAAPNNVAFRTRETFSQAQVGALVRTRASAHEAVEVAGHHVGRAYLGAVPYRFNELSRDAWGLTTTLRSRRSVGGRPIALSVAAEASHLRDRRLAFGNEGGDPTGEASANQDETVLAVAPYASAQVELFPALTLLAGGRYDRATFAVDDHLVADGDASDRRVFDAATGMFGTTVRLTDGLSIWGNVADAFETPTVTELSARPDGQAGFVDALRPQRARNAEIGVRGRARGIAAELGAFRVDLRDELVPFEADGRTYYRNAGRSHRLGAEAALSIALPGELAVAAAWSALAARFDDYVLAGEQLAGNTVPGTPPHRVGATVDWGEGLGPWVGADLELLAPTFADDSNTERTDPQRLVGARAGYRGLVGRFRWQAHVGVANVLDEVYTDNLRVNASEGRFHEPGPPRTIYGGVTFGRERVGG